MNRQRLLQQVVGATLAMVFLVGCGAPAATPVSEAPVAESTQISSVVTPTPEPPTVAPTPAPPTATPTPKSPTTTPTPAPPTPTPEPPAATPTLAPTISSSRAVVPVKLEHPIVLMDDYLKITVSTITNLGDQVSGRAGVNAEKISIRPGYKDTHDLLALAVLVEKMTDQEWGFGTLCFDSDTVAQIGWAGQGCLSMEDESSRRLDCAGAGYSAPLAAPSDVFWHSGFFLPVESGSTEEMYLAFVVPNELEQLTLALVAVLAKP